MRNRESYHLLIAQWRRAILYLAKITFHRCEVNTSLISDTILSWYTPWNSIILELCLQAKREDNSGYFLFSQNSEQGHRRYFSSTSLSEAAIIFCFLSSFFLRCWLMWCFNLSLQTVSINYCRFFFLIFISKFECDTYLLNHYHKTFSPYKFCHLCY